MSQVNLKKISICFLLALTLSFSVIALSGCGGKTLNGDYVCEKSSKYQLEMYSNGTSNLFTDYGTFHGKYAWDNDDQCYYITMEPNGLWPETIYIVTPDGDDVIISGEGTGPVCDQTFRLVGKPDGKPNN